MKRTASRHVEYEWTEPDGWDADGEWLKCLGNRLNHSDGVGPIALGETGPSERGQSTVEYAILLLGAAAVAMLVVAWVSKSDVVGRLFDTVFGRIISQA